MPKDVFLTLQDRMILQNLVHNGMNKKEIADVMGFCRSTIFRELRRCQNAYNAEEAQNSVFKSHNCIDWDIIGKRFGLLTVEKYANTYNRRTWWHCQCDCGKKCIMNRKTLSEYCSKRRPLSCGCIPKQSGGRLNKIPIEESMLRKYQDLLKFRKIEGDCWEWTGYMQNGKSGKTSWNSVSMTVRKCMYLLMNGTTYEPNPVFTTCGNFKCFNPEHITIERPKTRQFYE